VAVTSYTPAALCPKKCPWYSFLLKLNDPKATVRLKGLGKFEKKINNLIRNRNLDLLASSIMPEPETNLHFVKAMFPSEL
jgi:hypothetical protein